MTTSARGDWRDHTTTQTPCQKGFLGQIPKLNRRKGVQKGYRRHFTGGGEKEESATAAGKGGTAFSLDLNQKSCGFNRQLKKTQAPGGKGSTDQSPQTPIKREKGGKKAIYAGRRSKSSNEVRI